MPRSFVNGVRRLKDSLGERFFRTATSHWIPRRQAHCPQASPAEYWIDAMQLEDRIMLSASPIDLSDADLEGSTDHAVMDFPSDWIGDADPGTIEIPANHSEGTTTADMDSSESRSLITDPDITLLSDDPIEKAILTSHPLTLDEGASAAIDHSLLEITDPDSTPVDLVYTVLSSPESGTLFLDGVPATSFTQADIDAGLVTYQHSGSEVHGDSFGFRIDDGLGLVAISTFHIQVNQVNDAPVLFDADVTMDDTLEDSSIPIGAVGTLVSDVADVIDGNPTILRTDIVPFYAASNDIWAQRGIGWWWTGWQDWAAKSKLTLEKHGELWIHTPYGTLGASPYDFAGKTHAAEGVFPYHGPLPHIAEGLAHYYQQILQPADRITFYVGPPSQIYEDGMTFETFRGMMMYELSDMIALDAYANVQIGFDATYGQSESLGGIWTVLGGESGYIARVLLELDAMGIDVILEPWVATGATWAYGFDTISTDWFFRTEGLHMGDTPVHDKWADRSLLSGAHYHLLANDSDIANYYGGSWETAALEVMACGDIPLVLLKPYGLFDHAWVVYPNELIDPESLIPLTSSDLHGNSEPLIADGEDHLDLDSLYADSLYASHDGPSADDGPNPKVDHPVPQPSPTDVVGNVNDADIGAAGGIAIVGASTANGHWWYSTDGGTIWHALGTVSSNSALLLAADSDTRIYFEPNANFSGTIPDALTFHAWDSTDGIPEGTFGMDVSSPGGSSPFSSTTDTASIAVIPVNDAPVNTIPGPQYMASNAVLEFTFAEGNTIQVADIDGDYLTVTLIASGGAILLGDAGVITVVGGSNGSNTLVIAGMGPAINSALNGTRFVPAAGFSGPASLQIHASDGKGGTDDDTIVITVDGTPIAVGEMYLFDGDCGTYENGDESDSNLEMALSSTQDGVPGSKATFYPIDSSRSWSYHSDLRVDPIQSPGAGGLPAIDCSIIDVSAWIHASDKNSILMACDAKPQMPIDPEDPSLSETLGYSLKELWLAFDSLGDQLDQERTFQEFLNRIKQLFGMASAIGGILWIFRRGYLTADLPSILASNLVDPLSISKQQGPQPPKPNSNN